MVSTTNIPKLLSRYRRLAPSASVRVSALCLGAMTFGTAHPECYGEITKDTAFEILDYFYSQGGNFLDTANAYRDGQSEIWLGEWMASRKNRDQMVLATKYSSGYLTHEKDKIQANYGGNGTKSMKLSLEASLRKLQTTYIDLFYVHWWDCTIKILEMMHSLNDLVVAGKVLNLLAIRRRLLTAFVFVGISDCPAWAVTKANQYARDHGLRPFVVYQGQWSAAKRDFKRDIIPMCRDEGMGLCPYGALNQGRFQTAAVFAEREKHNPGRKSTPTSDHDRQVSKVLEDIAEAKGRQITEIALAYVMQKTPYVFPIVGSRRLEHIQGNAAALSVLLTEGGVEKIEAAYPLDHGFPHTFLSGSYFDRRMPGPANGPGDIWLTETLGTFDWVEGPRALDPHRE